MMRPGAGATTVRAVSTNATAWPVRPLVWPRRELLLPLLLAAVAQADVWAARPYGLGHMTGPRPLVALLYVVTSLALFWRKRAPLAVLSFVLMAEAAVYLSFGAPEGLGSFLPPLFAFYAVGRYAPAASVAVAAPLAALGTAVHELKDPAFQFNGSEVFFWVVLAAAWPLGQAFQHRAAETEALTARAHELARDREHAAQQAVDAERARIARELHDVVGHGLSVVVLQLVAALGLAEKGEAAAVRTRLVDTERSARAALTEMRRLLDLLDERDAPLVPASLGELERLIADTRAAGAQIDLTVTGERIELPAGVDLAAFRILQEALTNVLKHARPPHAHIHITYCRDAVTVEVSDEGRAPTNPGQSARRGLTGIRERVALYDGQLELGPQPGGGYLGRAHLPVQQ